MLPKYLKDLFVVLIGLIILFYAMGYIVRLDPTIMVIIGLLLLAHGVLGILEHRGKRR